MGFWDVLWLIFWSVMFVAYLIVLFHVVKDIFSDSLRPGWVKAVWILGVLLFPLLGAVAILSTWALAVLARGRRRGLLVAAVGLTVLAGLVTRLGNQPINAVVIGWTPEAPPTDWQALRDRWWGLHLVRTAVMASAYVVLTLGCLVPSSAREPARRA